MPIKAIYFKKVGYKKMNQETILQALKAGKYTKYVGVIEYTNEQSEPTGLKQWADLYAIDETFVLAEPFSVNQKGERHYYNREWDFIPVQWEREN